jgi:hypothetical protein
MTWKSWRIKTWKSLIARGSDVEAQKQGQIEATGHARIVEDDITHSRLWTSRCAGSKSCSDPYHGHYSLRPSQQHGLTSTIPDPSHLEPSVTHYLPAQSETSIEKESVTSGGVLDLDATDLRIYWGSEICRLAYLVHLLRTGRVKDDADAPASSTAL